MWLWTLTAGQWQRRERTRLIPSYVDTWQKTQWREDNRRDVVCRYETEWCWAQRTAAALLRWRHTSFSRLYLIPLISLHCRHKQHLTSPILNMYMYLIRIYCVFVRPPPDIRLLTTTSLFYWILSVVIFFNITWRLRTQQHIQKRKKKVTGNNSSWPCSGKLDKDIHDMHCGM